jgi:hypothetical protein
VSNFDQTRSVGTLYTLFISLEARTSGFSPNVNPGRFFLRPAMPPGSVAGLGFKTQLLHCVFRARREGFFGTLLCA